MPSNRNSLSIILPCYNETDSLELLLAELKRLYSKAQIVVVDDGSDVPVPKIQGITVIRHPTNLGNGAAVKTGARYASGHVFVFMDSDGQHKPTDIERLLAKIDEGYDMAVGARKANTHASIARLTGNTLYNRLASWMTGCRIDDLTSGFRAVRSVHFRKFLYLLPNRFSYPTTSTMAFFRCGHSVAYVPIEAAQRTGVGKSNIRLLRDGVRFLIIILKVGALFSPMRFFLPLSLALFVTATSYYGYTFVTQHRFTNMSAVLYLSSLFTFLFGIVSEQVSSLHYRYSEERRRASDFSESVDTNMSPSGRKISTQK